jgi:hypothetical protein
MYCLREFLWSVNLPLHSDSSRAIASDRDDEGEPAKHMQAGAGMSSGLHWSYVSGGIQSRDRERLIGTWNVSAEIVLQA